MADSSFKSYARGRRTYSVDALFTSGMLFTNGAIDQQYMKTLVNYNITNNGEALIPRSGLRTSELMLPDILSENDPDNCDYHTDENITIMAAKDCKEVDGKTYRQLILGRPQTADKEAMLWLVTVPESDIVLTNLAGNETTYSYDITVSQANANIVGMPCAYFTAPLTKIHGMLMEEDSQVATLVGEFAFGNGFYFVNPSDGFLYTTELSDSSKRYEFKQVTPKSIDPSEAVSYGYNMLAGEDAYSFVNRALNGVIQLTGILPYSTKTGELLMTPRKNEEVYLRCYFEGEVNQKYKFTWEWRNVGDTEWTSITEYEKAETYTIIQNAEGNVVLRDNDGTTVDNLEVTFKAPTEEIMVRVQAYNVTSNPSEQPIVEKAMTVGFDFTIDTYGTATNIKQEVYNLATATGMAFWKNRLVLYGIPKDPTILFLSDTNDASYFPYPNNISIFEEPIVAVQPYMDDLLVFTSSKIYQLTLSEDGTSWKATVVQSSLSIEPWDRHLIQIVRNMVFFKSGNYYFMIVPRAQSTTGELVLAPISTSLVEFFNNFEKNVTDVLQDTFDYTGLFSLINYYNFLDYEDVHNIYVFKFQDDVTEKSGYLHLDLLYNTVSRSWRIHTYEAPHFLYPYKHDATQNGILASTSSMNVSLEGSSSGTVISVKQAGAAVEGVTSLFLSEDGYDFNNTESLVVKVTAPTGYEETFNLTGGFTWVEAEHIYRITGTSCKLENELLYEGPGFTFTRSDGKEFSLGSTVVVYKSSNTENPIWGPREIEPKYGTVFQYGFAEDFIEVGTVIEVDGSTYEIDGQTQVSGSVRYTCSSDENFWITESDNGYLFKFVQQYPNGGPIVTAINHSETVDDVPEPVVARSIQLYKFDQLTLSDFYIPAGVGVVCNEDVEGNYFGYDPMSIRKIGEATVGILDERFRFKNWQFLDTGYRNDSIEHNKRYRELQFQLNNIEGANLQFGLEFQIDGQTRLDYYNYEVEQVVDETDSNYGLIYVEASPDMNINLSNIETPEETILGEAKSMWTLDQSFFPELSLWKVRVPVSGKGAAPRVRLLSRNPYRYELMSIHWIYRIMYMR